MGEMVNLTKLDLRYTEINVLPVSIGRLQASEQNLCYDHDAKKYCSSFCFFHETLPCPVLRLQGIEKLSIACKDDISSLPEELATFKNLNMVSLSEIDADTRFSERGSYFRFLMKLAEGCRLLSALTVTSGILSHEEQKNLGSVLAHNQNRYKTFRLRNHKGISPLKLWPFAIEAASKYRWERAKQFIDIDFSDSIFPLHIEQPDNIYSFLCVNTDTLVGHFLSLRERGASMEELSS